MKDIFLKAVAKYAVQGGVILMVLVAGGAIWYFEFNPAPWMSTTDAPQIAGVPKEVITPPAVKVLAPIAKKKLGLPKQIQEDKNMYALGAARIPSSSHAQTVTPVFNALTGETDILVREEATPWLAREQTGALRLDHDFTRSRQVISVRQDLLQTKSLHWGVAGSIDTQREWSALLGCEIRW